MVCSPQKLMGRVGVSPAGKIGVSTVERCDICMQIDETKRQVKVKLKSQGNTTIICPCCYVRDIFLFILIWFILIKVVHICWMDADCLPDSSWSLNVSQLRRSWLNVFLKVLFSSVLPDESSPIKFIVRRTFCSHVDLSLMSTLTVITSSHRKYVLENYWQWAALSLIKRYL